MPSMNALQFTATGDLAHLSLVEITDCP